MNELYKFNEYLEDHVYGFKSMRYEADIMYKAVCFNKYGNAYKRYIENNKKVGDYDAIRYDIKDYEKRIANAKYSGKITF